MSRVNVISWLFFYSLMGKWWRWERMNCLVSSQPHSICWLLTWWWSLSSFNTCPNICGHSSKLLHHLPTCVGKRKNFASPSFNAFGFYALRNTKDSYLRQSPFITLWISTKIRAPSVHIHLRTSKTCTLQWNRGRKSTIQVSESVGYFGQGSKAMWSSAGCSASAPAPLWWDQVMNCSSATHWTNFCGILRSDFLQKRTAELCPSMSSHRRSCSALAFFSPWPHTCPAPCTERENINRASDVKHRCAASPITLLAHNLLPLRLNTNPTCYTWTYRFLQALPALKDSCSHPSNITITVLTENLTSFYSCSFKCSKLIAEILLLKKTTSYCLHNSMLTVVN